MDLITAITSTVGPAVSRIIGDIWQDYRTGRQMRNGMAVNAQGDYKTVPNDSGIMSIPDSGFIVHPEEEASILLTGQFIAEESFIDFTDILLDEEDQQVVVLLTDIRTGDVYFFGFDFDGYAIRLWPGDYSLYAYIVDPIDDETLGFGFPLWDGIGDPNPITIQGFGSLGIDFFIYDVEDFF